MYADRILTCADCGQEFAFSADEQRFYAERGFTEPRRCASCRAIRKANRDTAGGGAGKVGRLFDRVIDAVASKI